MNTKNAAYALVLAAFLGTGCARLKEVPKVIWGSSTRALEDVRSEAIAKTYDCIYDGCFQEVLNIAQEKKLTVFMSDKKTGRIVLLGIPSSINTTEVGVFFSDRTAEHTKVEITSLSLPAKNTAAKLIFTHLAEVFKEIP